MTDDLEMTEEFLLPEKLIICLDPDIKKQCGRDKGMSCGHDWHN